MASPGGLFLLFLVITINLCNSHWTDNRDRRMPPPVMSVLEKLRSLGIQGSRRDARDIAVDNLPIARESKENILNTETDNSQDSIKSHMSLLPHQREKRYVYSSIAMRGCHLGTCQIQNLANMLYRLGNNNYKDGSNKDTRDPQGYGRRRRSVLQDPKRTSLYKKLLVT
ncbi:hypothetical protein FKM82_013313 [Ascaphus truei]